MVATRRKGAEDKDETTKVITTPVVTDDGPTKAVSAETVKAEEGKVRKVLVRTISGGLFVIVFNVVIWAGHLYTLFFIALLQFGCFREMVRGHVCVSPLLLTCSP